MLVQDRYPDVTDEQIRSELYAVGRGDEELLRVVFAPGILALATRIGDFVTKSAHNETLQDVAHFHPVNHNIPFTSLPPYEYFRPPNDEDDTKAQVEGYLEEHGKTVAEGNGLDDRAIMSREEFSRNIASEIFANGRSTGVPNEQWLTYTQSHGQEHDQNFCSLVAIAADVARRKSVQGGKFIDIERHLIDKHLTYQYPASLTQTTSCPQRTLSYIRMPKSKEIDDTYAEQLIRAAGFIMDWAGVDKVFEQTMMDAAQNNAKLVHERMLRVLDRPTDESRAPIRSIQEGVGRAILPVVAEVLRSSGVPTGKTISQITRLSPLGYAGPVMLQGAGLDSPLVGIDAQGTQRVSVEAQSALDSMQTYWRRHYHYPLLRKSEQADEADKRTGIGCPFAVSMRNMPDVVSAFTDLLLLTATKIDDRPSPAYDETPYRPQNVRGLLVDSQQLAA